MLTCVSRKVISWVLVIGLLSGYPVWGADSGQVIGKIIVSSGASSGGVILPSGGTILADDLLSTAKGGRALVEFSPTTRAALAEDTAVRFRQSEGALVAEVSLGTLVAERRESAGLVVETPEYKVEPADHGKALYLVAMLPDKSTVVAARYGQVSITEVSSGENYLLAEGEYAQIPPLSAGAPQRRGQQGPQAAQAAHGKINKPWRIGRLSHAASVAIVALIVIGAALAIALPIALEEEKPVSPVTP